MLNGAKMAGAFSRTQTRMQVSSYGRTNNGECPDPNADSKLISPSLAGNVYLLNAVFVGTLASGPAIFAAGANTSSSTPDDLSTAFPDFDFSEMGTANLSNLTLSAEQPAELAQTSTSGAAKIGACFGAVPSALLMALLAMLVL